MDWNLTWKMKMDEQLQMEKVFNFVKKIAHWTTGWRFFSYSKYQIDFNALQIDNLVFETC